MIPVTTSVRVRPMVLYLHHTRVGSCPRVKEMIRMVREGLQLWPTEVIKAGLYYNPLSFYVYAENGCVYVCRKALTANRVDVIDVYPTPAIPIVKETA